MTEPDVYADEYAEEPQGRILWGRFAFWGVALLVVFLLGRCTAGDGVSEAEYAEARDEIVELSQENQELRNQLEAEDAGGVEDNTDDTDETDVEDESETADASGGGETYEVQSGDTLRGIAERVYGDPDQIEPIIEANGLDRDAPLRVGQELTIPDVDG